MACKPIAQVSEDIEILLTCYYHVYALRLSRKDYKTVDLK